MEESIAVATRPVETTWSAQPQPTSGAPRVSQHVKRSSRPHRGADDNAAANQAQLISAMMRATSQAQLEKLAQNAVAQGFGRSDRAVKPRPGATVVHELSESTASIDALLRNWIPGHDQLIAALLKVDRAAGGLQEMATDSLVTARQIKAVSGHVPLALAVNIWAQVMPDVIDTLTDIRETMPQIVECRDEMQPKIELLHVYNVAAASLLSVMLKTNPWKPTRQHLSNLDLIHQAAATVAHLIRPVAEKYLQLTMNLAQQIDSVLPMLHGPFTVIEAREHMETDRDTQALRNLIPDMVEHMHNGLRWAHSLKQLRVEVRKLINPTVASEIRAELDLAGQLIDDMRTPTVVDLDLGDFGARGIVVA